MLRYNNPPQTNWSELMERPNANDPKVMDSVRMILDEVKQKGDAAVTKYTWFFDRVKSENVKVSQKAIAKSANELSNELKEAIQLAARNIRRFHSDQVAEPKKTEVQPGVTCWREQRAIDAVGLYIPGGSAPLFSTVLMLGIPAAIAGCKRKILCTPPQKDGSVHPAILYAAQLVGCNEIYAVGGVQAIAALTYGTATIPKVDKIFGPGNGYVTAAKQLVAQERVAIDMPAGPSEVLVIADSFANPRFVAADLLSQAEHGADSQVLLLTTDAQLANEVEQILAEMLVTLPRKIIAEKALQNSCLIVLETLSDCLAFSNAYAPEHLILAL